MLRQTRTDLIVEETIVVAAIIIIVLTFLLMGRAKGSTCYMHGCGRKGVHVVRVCEDHRK